MTLPKKSELPLIKSRAEARWAALKRLLELHAEEYDQIHREERTNRGLPAETGVSRLRTLERENTELRERLARLVGE